METKDIQLGLWGAALGAFALFGIGFGPVGWVLGGTALERAETAVVERLTPICVAQSKQDSKMAQKIQTLQKLPYEKRGEFVANQGWATMPGEKKPDSLVAEKCSDQLTG